MDDHHSWQQSSTQPLHQFLQQQPSYCPKVYSLEEHRVEQMINASSQFMSIKSSIHINSWWFVRSKYSVYQSACAWNKSFKRKTNYLFSPNIFFVRVNLSVFAIANKSYNVLTLFELFGVWSGHGHCRLTHLDFGSHNTFRNQCDVLLIRVSSPCFRLLLTYIRLYSTARLWSTAPVSPVQHSIMFLHEERTGLIPMYHDRLKWCLPTRIALNMRAESVSVVIHLDRVRKHFFFRYVQIGQRKPQS